MGFMSKRNWSSWFHGYMAKKADYPPPWNTDPCFPVSRLLRDPFDSATAEIIGITLPQVLYAMFAVGHRVFYAVTSKYVAVEWMPESGDKIAMVLDRAGRKLMAAKVLNHNDVLPLAIKSSAGERNGLYLLYLLSHMANDGDGTIATSEISTVQDSLNVIVDAIDDFGYDSLLKYDNARSTLISIARGIYRAAADYPDYGIDETTGTYPWLSLETANEVARDIAFHAHDEKIEMLLPTGVPYLFSADDLDRELDAAFLGDDDVEEHLDDLPEFLADAPRHDIIALRQEYRLPLSPGRVYTDDELASIPEMDAGYVISDSHVSMVEEIYEAYPFLEGLGLAANIMLVGDAGSGKTQTSRFLADVFHRPRTKETLRADTDESTLLGGFYPCFKDLSGWEGLSDTDKTVCQRLEELVQVSGKDAPRGADDVLNAICASLEDEDMRAEIRSAYGVPSLEECLIDPENAWKALGKDGECPGFEAVASVANAKAEQLQFRLLNILYAKKNEDKVSYRFLESQLLKAFERGWLLEIQEAATVRNPGVLSILNSLLEPNGTIELPGRVVKRHPDTIVVVTTNVGYEGCRKLNEAFKDRMLCCDLMNTPSAGVMAERIKARIKYAAERAGKNFTISDTDAMAAATVVWDVAQKAKSLDILGVYGMRSLLFWGLQLCMGHTSREHFMRDVVYKMTTDEDDIAILEEAYLNSKFAAQRDKYKIRKDGKARFKEVSA